MFINKSLMIIIMAPQCGMMTINYIYRYNGLYDKVLLGFRVIDQM